MAEEKETLERIYTIPLRRAILAPKQRRAKRTIKIIKEFAMKHMKSSEIKLSSELNEKIWEKGIRNSPRRITVKMVKDEEGVVTVSLPKEE